MVLLVAGTAAILRFYAVPLSTTAIFAGYLVLGIALPGTLVWRALYRGDTFFAADVAAGTALGYVGEVLIYIPARAIGLPLLVLAWPVGVIVAFLAVPALRRHWRQRSTQRPPALWSWSLAASVAAVILWSCKFFRLYGLSWPYYSSPDTDSTFHLALIGEAKHHMPMATPWISGEPLFYHWFVYADLAATSWVTGIEPQVLLLRLSMLPMLAAFVVLVAVLARRLFGHWWTGIAAVVLTLFVLAPNPYGWPLTDFYTGLGFSNIDDGSVLRMTVWTGPTQTFGALLFAPLVLVLIDLLAGPRDKRRWLLFTVLAAGVMGAKATFLPVLVAGLLAVVGVHLVRRRRPHRAALIATGIVAVGLVFAQLVLFGARNQGLRLQPLEDVATSGMTSTGYFLGGGRSALVVVALIAIGCWLVVWAGISGLIRATPSTSDGVWLLLGIGVAGIGATMLFGQSGSSQRFFFESARPYLSLAAVGGLAAVVRPRFGARVALALGAAAVVGAGSVHIIRRLDGPRQPTIWNSHGLNHLTFALLWPYAALAVVALGAVVVLGVARRRVSMVRGLSHALIVALLAGFGLATTYSNFRHVADDAVADGWRHAPPVNPIVSEGTLEAGRWLRDHSDPNDLVATNVHCLPAEDTHCLNLHFAVSAYSERRMLVEGWGFSATAHQRAADLNMLAIWVPYWRPDVLADNDRAFATPSASAMDRLRDKYGVRWLFVDHGASLEPFAALRFRGDGCAVYEILRPGEHL